MPTDPLSLVESRLNQSRTGHISSYDGKCHPHCGQEWHWRFSCIFWKSLSSLLWILNRLCHYRILLYSFEVYGYMCMGKRERSKTIGKVTKNLGKEYLILILAKRQWMSFHRPEITQEYSTEFTHGCLLMLFFGQIKKVLIMRTTGSQCSAHTLLYKSCTLAGLCPSWKGGHFIFI